jgi:hypothetical protein
MMQTLYLALLSFGDVLYCGKKIEKATANVVEKKLPSAESINKEFTKLAAPYPNTIALTHTPHNGESL